MNIAKRIQEAEQKYEKLQQQRNEIDTEMVKLQGEWRVLSELNKEVNRKPDKPKKSNKATVIEAVPEKEK